jgi:hypothetical protein
MQLSKSTPVQDLDGETENCMLSVQRWMELQGFMTEVDLID